MVAAVVDAVEKPVYSKKCERWDEDYIFAIENAKAVERAGGQAGSQLHGRTRVQMYEGKADWGIIKQVKQAVNIPGYGNGDVATPARCKA